MYPEWIQEQLDKIAATNQKPNTNSIRPTENPTITDQRLGIRLAAVESRIIHHMYLRFDRIEAKLDHFIKLCEEAVAE